MAKGLISLVLKPHRHITEKRLEKLQKKDYYKVLQVAAQKGVEALASATPKKTGRTAASWTYEIETSLTTTKIYWKNDNVTRDGVPIAILLQYGHGTGTGGYVVGMDYINPAIRPIFEDIADEVWEAIIAT